MDVSKPRKTQQCTDLPATILAEKWEQT